MPNEARRAKAQQLLELWEMNEETMGEQAAYQVACEQLGIDPDDGYAMLAELQDREEKVADQVRR